MLAGGAGAGAGGAGGGGFSAEALAAQLAATEGDWQVIRTLKGGPHETTQLVRRAGGVDAGPFVRKAMRAGAGRGGAYEAVWRAQVAGARFQHLPFIYDMARDGDELAVVMEYVAGETLAQVMARTGPSPALAGDVGARLCDALSELHSAPGGAIVHRDVKPGNIMLSASRFVLIDLGIAREFKEGAPRDTVRFGTPGYAPPEQYGFGQTSPRSDLYAAGMVIAYLCTGEHPTDALREAGFAHPMIPVPLQPVLRRATAFDPAARYASAEELKAAIAAALDPAWDGREGQAEQAAAASSQAALAPTAQDVAAAFASGQAALQNMPPTHVTIHISQDAPEPEPPAHAGPLQNMPEPIGKVWNALVLAAWAVFAITCVLATFIPGETMAAYPPAMRFVGYLALLIAPSTMLAVALMDRRRLAAWWPRLDVHPWRRFVLTCFAGAVVFGIAIAAMGAGAA